MPQIIYIRKNPPSPIRRMPKGVLMSTVEPCPYIHSCGKRAILYADGVIWCNPCGRKVKTDECRDMRRGRFVPPPDQPQWKPIDLDK